MDVKIENYINVWYDQIPPLLIDLINTITLAMMKRNSER